MLQSRQQRRKGRLCHSVLKRLTPGAVTARACATTAPPSHGVHVWKVVPHCEGHPSDVYLLR